MRKCLTNEQRKGGIGQGELRRAKSEFAHVYGSGLAARRELAGISQTELADRIGVRQTQVSRWEIGEAIPSLFFARRIKAVLAEATKSL